MLKKLLAAAICSLILLLAVGCKSEDQIQQSAQEGNTRHEVVIKQEHDTPQNIIKVSGSGEVNADPDIAEVSLAVVSQDKDAAVAELANNETMSAVMEVLRNFSIADADIESTYFNMRPIYDYSSEKESITGYRVNNEIRVTIRDLDKTGQILSAAMAAGANEVGHVTFTLEDAGEAYRNALKAAVKDAAMKAEAMAESAGVSIAEVPYSVEETSYSITPMSYDSVAVMEETENDAAVTSSVPVSSGEISITARVEIQYLIDGTASMPAEN